jgi:hypothetical protein
VAAPPQLSPAKLVQYVKGKSSRRLQEEFPHLRKRYWGQHLWARGYFCATVGAVDEKTIMEYIENQKWDEEVDGFKITNRDPVYSSRGLGGDHPGARRIHPKGMNAPRPRFVPFWLAPNGCAAGPALGQRISSDIVSDLRRRSRQADPYHVGNPALGFLDYVAGQPVILGILHKFSQC